MTYFITFLIGTAFGFLLLLQFSKWDANQKIKKLKEQHDSVFLEIERLIGTKSLYFLGRYNNNVTFKVITKDSKMDLVFFLDKKDICLFKKDQCLYSTQFVDKRIVENICSKLEQSFSTEMSDCVKIMGNIIDRKTVLKLNPYVEFPPAFPVAPPQIFTIDDILDRISEVGLDNLNSEEKQFLNEYQKNQKS